MQDCCQWVLESHTIPLRRKICDLDDLHEDDALHAVASAGELIGSGSQSPPLQPSEPQPSPSLLRDFGFRRIIGLVRRFLVLVGVGVIQIIWIELRRVIILLLAGANEALEFLVGVVRRGSEIGGVD